MNKDDVLGKQFQTFYEEYNSPEAIEKRRLEQLEKEKAFNRLEDEFSLSVEYHFPENTLQQTIKEALTGKVVNPSLYAAEFAWALRSSVSMPDKTVEERSAYREMALKQAQYIAENYFGDEQEAASFMNIIIKYYENDLLREKGYVVFDNSDLEPFKKPTASLDEQQVEAQVSATKSIIESFTWVNGLVTETQVSGYWVDIIKWNKDMLNLFVAKT